MKYFEPIDHPSDIGIIAYGSDLKELFSNAASGMFSLMTDISKIKAAKEYIIRVDGEDNQSLLINWLNELIYLFDSKKVLLGKFEIAQLRERSLSARVFGDMIEKGKVELLRPIKAATYNQLSIKNAGTFLSAKIVFDV